MNEQLYPLQRNRYYSGKLLTSEDFKAEQDYYNNRSRIMNSLMYGSGVVCGLGVVSLDDLSILIESGVAIDGSGHEIILPNSIVKKLSAIEGFDEIETEKATLCIAYTENLKQSVYTINHESQKSEYEYARIEEGAKLFLVDSEKTVPALDIEDEFLTRRIIFENTRLRLEAVMPSTVSKGHDVMFQVEATALSDEAVNLTFEGIFQLPQFETADGRKEVKIVFDSETIPEGKKVVKSEWLRALPSEEKDTVILLRNEGIVAFVNDIPVQIENGFELKILLSYVHPRALVNREIGRMSLEMKDLGGLNEYIRLADITIEKSGSAYMISSINETDVKKYVPSPGQELIRSDYLEYFYKVNSISEAQSFNGHSLETQSIKPDFDMSGIPKIATGIVEIPLGNDVRKGDIRYSGEIMHGLGVGNVYVDIGFESISQDKVLEKNARSTIYGNADLFMSNGVDTPNVDTAIKVLNDKGSFVVAAKINQNLDYLVLTYRWVAIKFPSGDEMGIPEDYTGKSIIPETPTVVLNVRESHFFGVRFENMESCSVIYELTEEGSGEITADGIYTAPNREGVFEIRIYCANMPVICSYAYAIVKRGVEDGQLPSNDKPQDKSERSLLNELPI